MPPVHSQLLFRAPSFSGLAVVQFTAPAGFRTIVKQIGIIWGDVVVSGLDAWVQTQDLTKLSRITLAALPTSSIGGQQITYGMWGLLPGDTLACQTATGTADFYASGFLLALP